MLTHYYWEGISRSGKKLSGCEKISRAHLKRKLLAQDITILKIRYRFKNKNPYISQKKINVFTLEFFTLLNSGIAIQETLQILAQTSEDRELSWLSKMISHKIAQGSHLSDALKSLPDYFNTTYCHMIVVGEQSGTLLEMLEELIHMQKQLDDIRTTFWKAISYPAFIVLSTILITSGLLLFVMPKFQDIFSQAKIPLPYLTSCLITFSEYFRLFWPIIFLLIFTIPTSLYFLWKKNIRAGLSIETMILQIPMLGSFIQSTNSARLARVLASSLKAGLPLSKTLEVSGPTSQLHIYQKGIRETLQHIKNGETFALALKKTGFLSKSIGSLIGIGETAGRLDEMLSHIAEMEQQKLKNAIDTLSKWLEPVMMIILGCIVGGMIIAMYLPVFQMNSGI